MPVFRRQDGRRSPAEAMQQLRAASAVHLRERARRARRTALLLAPLVAGVLLVNHYRVQLFGLDEPVRLLCSVALVGLGALFARDFGRALSEPLTRRVDPGTAGTIGFLVRPILLGGAAVVSLRMAGGSARAPAGGGGAPPGVRRARSRPAVSPPRSCSAWPRRPRWATCSPGCCCSACDRSGSATASAFRPAAWPA